MKSFLLLSILISIGFSSFSQKVSQNQLPVKLKSEPRFYISIHGGYAFAMNSTFKFYPDNISSVAIKKLDNAPLVREIDYEADSKGLGEGYRAGAGLSYIINDFINVGIDVEYFESSISKLRDSSFYSSHTILGSTREWDYRQQYKISYETSLLMFSPNITFKAIARPKFFIYNKLGAIIILHPSGTQHDAISENFIVGKQAVYTDSSATTRKQYEWGVRNPAFGFMGGIGCQAKVTGKVRVFAELQFSHIIFEEQKRVLTSYEINGNEIISTLSRRQKETIYKKGYKSDNAAANPDEPNVATYQNFPITYAGMQIGIIYRF